LADYHKSCITIDNVTALEKHISDEYSKNKCIKRFSDIAERNGLEYIYSSFNMGSKYLQYNTRDGLKGKFMGITL
jgi:hypothetical protein